MAIKIAVIFLPCLTQLLGLLGLELSKKLAWQQLQLLRCKIRGQPCATSLCFSREQKLDASRTFS